MRIVHLLLLTLVLALTATPIIGQEASTALEAPVLLQRTSLSVTAAPLDAVAYSPRGDFLAAGGRDTLIRLYNPAVSDQPALTLSAHTDRITALAFSPDGTLLTAASADRTVSVWAVDTLFAMPVPTPMQQIAQHTDVVTSVAFTTDAQGNLLLASGSRDGTIWLGDPTSGVAVTVIDQFDSPVWALTFAPATANGLLLATAAEDGTIWLWGMGASASLRRLNGHQGPAMSLAFDSTGTRLASGGIDGLLRLWDLSSAEPVATVLSGHLAPVTGLSWPGEVILTASYDGAVRAWDANGGLMLASLPGTGYPLTGLALRSDGLGAEVASIGTEGMLTLWQVDLQAAQQIVTRRARENNPSFQAVVPDAPGASPTSAPQVAAAPTIPPTANRGASISIPVANIRSTIITFPLDGVSWAIDPWERSVGHLEGTAWLDETGNVALGGHSEYPDGTPGIFARLYDVNVGDVMIVSENGIERRYVVIEKRTVQYDDVSVVYPTNDSRLTLITCDLPSLDPNTGTYLDRLVVVGRLVG
ncbi:MAG: sortase [bacterium]|nr:sortase [bacterium]